ncbi:MAG TPA: folylpolyglutamate synthase/dihydrofolate synthase family protein [Candidatus Ozemobacteraceae bacterium]|nr:folylpolyglutamate synthase/dihydrofolate synthase family protein [Candidatus Ozemobacteraceae bacterium]
MDFTSAIEWLSSRDLITGPFGLHRMEFLAERLGNPQHDVPCVVIGGTNGKGSVTVLLESMVASGNVYQTGATVSPHLVSLTERIRIQTGHLPEAEWARGVEALLDIVKLMEREPSIGAPSFFEIITALALWSFRETDRDLAFVEVGLGGRLDATNIIHPEVSVITNIGTDHQELLGSDRPSIAREKLGIVRPKVPLITGESDPEILRLFGDVCREKKIPLHPVGNSRGFRLLESTPTGHRLILDGRDAETFLPLPGEHQLKNLAIALEVIACLRKHGFDLPPDDIAGGVESVCWPGRLQWIDGAPPVLLDGAHNEEGLSSLTAYLDAFPPKRPLHVVFGALQKKPVSRMAAELAKRADSLAFVAPSTPRALSPEDFRALVLPSDPRWVLHETLDAALNAGAASGTILVTGSLYLVADYLRTHPHDHV